MHYLWVNAIDNNYVGVIRNLFSKKIQKVWSPSMSLKLGIYISTSSPLIITNVYFTKLPSRTKSITPIFTCESHLLQPRNFHMWSRENFNMQIRLKLCQIWRVEKFHTWKFQAWNFHTLLGLKLFTPKSAWKFSRLNRPENVHAWNRPENFHTWKFDLFIDTCTCTSTAH